MNDIEQLEDLIKANQQYIDKKNRLERLFNNHDFKELILEDYLKLHSLDLVDLLEKDNEEQIVSKLISKKHLKEFFDSISSSGTNAEKDKERNEETLIAILNERN